MHRIVEYPLVTNENIIQMPKYAQVLGVLNRRLLVKQDETQPAEYRQFYVVYKQTPFADHMTYVGTYYPFHVLEETRL